MIYKFLTKVNLNSSDTTNLSLLYLPFLKLEAASLYQYLTSLSLCCFEFEDKVLFLDLDISKVKFNHLKAKLEAIGLLKTYTKDKITYLNLFCPLNPYEFLKKSIYHSLYKQSVSDITYNNTFSFYFPHSSDLTEYKDISAKFDEIYTLKSVDALKSNFVYNLTRLEFNTSRFDLDNFYSLFRTKPNLSNKEIIRLTNIVDVYKFTTEEVFEIFNQCYNLGEFNLEQFLELASKKYYSETKEFRVISKDNEIDAIVEAFNLRDARSIVDTLIASPTREDILNLTKVLDEESEKEKIGNKGIFNFLLYLSITIAKKVVSYNYLLKVYKSNQDLGLYTLTDLVKYHMFREKTDIISKTKSKPVAKWQQDAWEKIKSDTESGAVYTDLGAVLGEENEEA